MNMRSLAISGLVFGTIMGVLSSIPVVQVGNYLCGLWLWGPAIFSVWLYVRLTGPGITMTNMQGAVVGGASGIVATIVTIFLTYAVMAAASLVGGEDLWGTIMMFSSPVICGAILLAPFFGAGGGRIGVAMFGQPHQTPGP